MTERMSHLNSTPCDAAEAQYERWGCPAHRSVLQRIVSWLRSEAPGAFVVTGAPGWGKSTVVRRVVALSDSAGRAELLAHAPLAPGDPDPGIGAVDAVVHLDGMSEQDMMAAVAEALGLPAPQASWQLIAEITKLTRPPVLVLDGLDEVLPEHADKIATELLVALGAVARVLLATEQREFLLHRPVAEPRIVGLAEMFGPQVSVVDLGAEASAPADLERYVAMRLQAGGRGDLVQQVAAVLGGKAIERGGFLYARMVASQVVRQLIDVQAQGWVQQLPATVGEALDRELASGAALVRDGVELPGAARDLLHGLAWTLGRGMPRGVWVAAASALSPVGAQYRPADLDWVLEHHGRYIVAGEQDGEAIYRLAHPELVKHLVGAPLPIPGSPASEALAEALVALPEARPPAEGEPDRRSPYLRRQLARHASIAGTVGVDALYRLVKDTPEAYLPDLARSVHQLATKLAELGQHESALAPARQAVSIYRILNEANATTYLPFLAMVLNDRAVYLSATGRYGEALAPGAEATDTLSVLTEIDTTTYLPHLVTSLNNLAGHLAGLDRISDGVDVYTLYVDNFAATPAVRDALIIERAGFHIRHGDPPTGLRELVTLLATQDTEQDTDTLDSTVLAVRNALRGYRSRDALAVHNAWRAVTGQEPPDWLALTPEQISLVVKWLTAPTWTISKGFFAAHQEELLADPAFVALEELELLVAPRADQHLDLLEEVLAVGVDEAYRPLLLEDLVRDWISVESWQESRAFAEEHATELVTTEAEAALIRLGHPAATVVHLAVLGLAIRDGLETAYGCVTDRQLAADRMRRALADADLSTIVQLAMLEGRVFGESYAATAHLAVAGSLAGKAMSDTTTLEELAEQADVSQRQRVAVELAELLSRVPEHAELLGPLHEILIRYIPK
ncbi:MAG TPA: AAA family ATPase [Pseudonocardiaceae bacterium]|nr:AAA family ATPase [Pseudonocardiaceae bacterium]